MTSHEDFVTALVAQLPGLRRYAVALAGNAALADDLVQDSIERALRQSAQLRDLQRLPALAAAHPAQSLYRRNPPRRGAASNRTSWNLPTIWN